MRRIPTLPLAIALLGLALHAAAPSAARAQGLTAFSLSAGIMHYNLAGDGNTPMLALRAEAPVSRTLLLEPGVVVAWPELEEGGRGFLALPQTILQYRIAAGSGVEPYLGGGAGIAFGFEDAGGEEVDILLTAAAGVRIDSGGLLGFVIDARAHAIGFDADAHLLELSFGVRIRR